MQENDLKEGIKPIAGRWAHNETSSSLSLGSGEVLCNGFATEQGKNTKQRGLFNSQSVFQVAEWVPSPLRLLR